MSDPDFKAEEAPPPQPPRPQPRSQLEQDEMYARQLAQHYQSQGGPRGQGGYGSRGEGQAPERPRSREPEREHSFFDGMSHITTMNIVADSTQTSFPRFARTSSRASRRRRRQLVAGSTISPRSWIVARSTSMTSTATLSTPAGLGHPNDRTLAPRSQIRCTASASRPSSDDRQTTTDTMPTTGSLATTLRSWR